MRNSQRSATFCAGDSVFLLAALARRTTNGRTALTGNQYWATLPGTYTVSSTQDGCTFTDDILVIEPRPCPPSTSVST